MSGHLGRLRYAAAALALVSCLAIASPTSDAATGAPLSGAGSCDRPFSTTLLETTSVRLYAMPKESKAPPAQTEPSIAGRPVFGCLRSTGKSRLLDLPEVGGERHGYWVEVDPHTVAANGALVAYAYTQYYFDTHETWIRVRDLRTGAIARDCFIGGGLAPRRRPRVLDIVLSSAGDVSWRAEGEEPGPTDARPPGCTPLA